MCVCVCVCVCVWYILKMCVCAVHIEDVCMCGSVARVCVHKCACVVCCQYNISMNV